MTPSKASVICFSAATLLVCSSASAQVDTHLAGNALTRYPLFETVRAINADAPVQVGIDPTRHPAVVGRTCDVYVVNDKTTEEWALDAALVDVTSDGPLTVTIAPFSIFANTFTVAAAGELASSAGTTGLGRPYDVVLDCDRDSMLGAPDFIDGRAPDQGGFYVVHDVAAPGPLATILVDYAVSGVPAGFVRQRTRYPADIASRGRLPLVVISHGDGAYTWLEYLQEHLASYGYVVMSHQNNTGPGIEAASTTTRRGSSACGTAVDGRASLSDSTPTAEAPRSPTSARAAGTGPDGRTSSRRSVYA